MDLPVKKSRRAIFKALVVLGFTKLKKSTRRNSSSPEEELYETTNEKNNVILYFYLKKKTKKCIAFSLGLLSKEEVPGAETVIQNESWAAQWEDKAFRALAS